jgi:DNA uptake protein ComE-like DNA-binding protein
MNREPAEALAVLPGIGHSRAKAIVAARPHCNLADLDRVSGIGPVTLARLADTAGFPVLPPDCDSQMRAKTH